MQAQIWLFAADCKFCDIPMWPPDRGWPNHTMSPVCKATGEAGCILWHWYVSMLTVPCEPVDSGAEELTPTHSIPKWGLTISSSWFSSLISSSPHLLLLLPGLKGTQTHCTVVGHLCIAASRMCLLLSHFTLCLLLSPSPNPFVSPSIHLAHLRISDPLTQWFVKEGYEPAISPPCISKQNDCSVQTDCRRFLVKH